MKLRSFLGVILTVVILSIGLVSISGCATTPTQTTAAIQPTSETPVFIPAPVVTTIIIPVPVVTTVTTPTPTPASITTPVQLSLYSPLTSQQVYPLIQSNPNIIIIDARATGEYTGAVTAGVSVGHLPGAYSVPDDGSAAQQLYKFPDKTLPYICYCDDAACAHGSNVASIMILAGYTNVTYMSDGIGGWTAQGYSLVTGG